MADRDEKDRIRKALRERLGAGSGALVKRAKKDPRYRFEAYAQADAGWRQRIEHAGFTIGEFWRAAHEGVLPVWWRP